MSTNNSSGGQHPRREKANLHPGQIVLNSQVKQRTPVEKRANNLRAQEIKDACAAAVQQGCTRVCEMEAAMEVEQARQDTVKAKPVRPRWGGNQGRPTKIGAAPRADSEVLFY